MESAIRRDIPVVEEDQTAPTAHHVREREDVLDHPAIAQDIEQAEPSHAGEIPAAGEERKDLPISLNWDEGEKEANRSVSMLSSKHTSNMS